MPKEYQRFFVHYEAQRSIPERVLSAVGLSAGDQGRSFALVAGVDAYPHLSSSRDRRLEPAAVDVESLVAYLRDIERFDEIVVLRNEDMTLANFRFFLQSYFPEHLSRARRDRFLFGYSGHGFRTGTRGYLVQSGAKHLEDKANAINLYVLRSFYQEVVDASHHSLALINACYSGAFHKRSFARERRLEPRNPGAHAITAGGTTERAWHHPDVGQGSVFFEKVFAGLAGVADRYPVQTDGSLGDGLVTAQELGLYLETEVQLESDQRQNPVASDISNDQSTGSFYFFGRDRQERARTVPSWTEIRAKVLPFGSAPSPPTPLKPEPSLPYRPLDRMQIALADPTAERHRAQCLSGDVNSCNMLGSGYEKGEGVSQDYSMAFGLYRQACDGGNAVSCSNLGFLYATGQGVSQDYAKAVRLYRQACDGGSMRGCSNLGSQVQEGKGVGQNLSEAVRLYRQACDGGSMFGCSNLGALFEKGAGIGQDYSKAVRLYRQACEGGIAVSCSNLGSLLGRGKGVGQNLSAAVVLYRQACDGGSMLGCSNLGTLFEKGEGVGQDYSMAFGLYRQACDDGIAVSCSNLGSLYFSGQGVGQNLSEAIRLYRQACDGGSMLGCSNLGTFFEKGAGVEQNYSMAFGLYRQACDGGIAVSCSNLGTLFEKGEGVGKDYSKAVGLYRRACDGGAAAGCSNLGQQYELGQGVTKHLSEAIRLYRRGCDGGHEWGCNRLESLCQRTRLPACP